LIGVFFRFAYIEDRVFWVDEVATAVRVSGYTIPEVIEDLQAKNIVSGEDLLRYQVLNQNSNLSDTWQALTKSPEHAPLYFLLARFWLQLWGNSIGVMRSLSAWLSLLIFPTLYWLYRELFNKPLVGWLGVTLMSVSPFYVAYAQEARPYSLWTVTILLMSASFLRAIRINNRQCWTLYIINLVFGFYTSLFSLLIAVFQGIYLLLAKLKNKRQLIKNYFISNAIAFIFFSLWLLIILTNRQSLQDNTVWMRNSINVADLIATWIGTILLIFGDLPISPDVDAVQMAIAVIVMLVINLCLIYLFYNWQKFNYNLKKTIIYLAIVILSFFTFSIIFIIEYFARYITLDLVTLIGALVAVGILSLASYSLSFLTKNSEQTQWLFIVCLMLSLPVPLLIIDLILQGRSSGAPRYLIPTQLAIQIAAAYTISNKLDNNKIKFSKQQQLWSLILGFFLTLGIFSCSRNLQISPIYLKNRNIHNRAIAEIINNSPTSLVLIESQEAIDILSLSHDTLPDVKFKLIDNQTDFVTHHNNFEKIFILKPSSNLKSQLSPNNKIIFRQVYQPQLLTSEQISLDLWQIIKR
jgi:uncharacterized membrane protein